MSTDSADMDMGDDGDDMGIGVNMDQYNPEANLEAVENVGDMGEVEMSEGDDKDEDDDDDEEMEEEEEEDIHKEQQPTPKPKKSHKTPEKIESAHKSTDDYQGLTMRSLQGLDFHERSVEFYKQVQIKKEMIENEQEEKEREYCPFYPQIHKEGESVERRTVEEFLDSQTVLEKKRQERLKLQIMERNKEENNLLQRAPEISETSRDLLKESEYTKDDITSRLTNSHKAEREELVAEYRAILDQDVTYKPQVGKRAQQLKREVRVQDWLYLDAQRRKDNLPLVKKQPKIIMDNTLALESPRDTLPPKGAKTLKYIISKFKKDFDTQFGKQDSEGAKKISYSGMYGVFKGMNMIPTQENEDRSNLLDLWDLLQGEKYSGVRKINLKICIAAILHIPLKGVEGLQTEFPMNVADDAQGKTTSPNDDLPTNKLAGPKSIGKFDLQGIYILDEREKLKLHRKFYKMYLNRQLRNKVEKAPVQSPLPEFKPKIGNKSYDLASSRKMKISPDAVLVDTLIDQGEDNKNWRNKIKQIKDQEEHDNCSFKPAIIKISQEKLGKMNRKTIQTSFNSEKKLPQRTTPYPSKHRWDDLHNLSKSQSHKGGIRQSDDIELERNAVEYTFHPKTIAYKTPKKPGNRSMGFHNKVVTAAVERMKKARTNKEVIEQAKNRGYTHIGNLYTDHIKYKGLLPFDQKNNMKIDSRQKKQTDKPQEASISPNETDFMLDNPNEIFAQELVEPQIIVENIPTPPLKEREPLILIDVNLGDKEEKIMIYDKDEDPRIVAHNFSTEHDLDVGMTEQLAELIEQQMAELN